MLGTIFVAGEMLKYWGQCWWLPLWDPKSWSVFKKKLISLSSQIWKPGSASSSGLAASATSSVSASWCLGNEKWQYLRGAAPQLYLLVYNPHWLAWYVYPKPNSELCIYTIVVNIKIINQHTPLYKFGPWPGCLDSSVGRPVAQGKISKIGTLSCRHMEECLKNQKQLPPKFMKPKESGPGTHLDIAKQLPTTF